MQTRCYFAFTFLYTLSLLSPMLSIQCNKTQYSWPVDNPVLCCNMCRPGEYMVRRSNTICEITCKACAENFCTDTYNVEMSCELCRNCTKLNMEFESKCNPNQQAVCRCKAGYKCKDQPCTECLPIINQSIITTTDAKPVTHTTLWETSKPIRDTVWFLVIIALLCAGFALTVATKIKPFLHWIRSKHGYFLASKATPVPPCSQDDEVSTPVQEVCGKCDQPIDV